MKNVSPQALAATAAQPAAAAERPGALILGGAHVSIALARSLGRQGIPVWLLANHPIARFSRYVRRSFPWPGGDHPEALPALLDIAARHDLRGWVLLPTGDQDMRMVAENHAALSAHFRMLTPDWETARWMFDKRLTYRRAAELGIDRPWTVVPQGAEDLAAIDCPFPVILKPAYRWGDDAFTLAKAWRANDREALLSLYKEAAALIGAEAVLLQECIEGAGDTQYSYAGVWKDGVALAALVARRTRQHPIDFGRSSTFVESIVQDEIEDAACRFLRSLNYSGVAEVEFKYDARERRYKLLDVNSRFWTWHGIGARAGTDFGHLAWRAALDMEIAPCSARAGVAWLHGSRDLVAAWQEMRAGRLTLGRYLKGLAQPIVFANLALDDPMPALAEIPAALWNRLTHMLRV